MPSQSRFTDAPPPPSTYGLATQLRTPPMDTAPSFHHATPISTKKVTPAMREEQRASPPTLHTPQWTTKIPSAGKDKLKRPSEKHSSRKAGTGMGIGMGVNTGNVVLGKLDWDEGGQSGGPNKPKKSHLRSQSSYRPSNPSEHGSPMERSSSAGAAWGAPSRPPRPPSPSLHPIPAIPANFKPGVSRQRSFRRNDSPKMDALSPTQNLDLNIEIDSPYSTYQASQSSPNLSINDAADEALRAQVGVAQRVSRGTSFSTGRKASVATIVQAPQQSGPLPPLPRMADPSFSHIRPQRPPSPNGTSRPIGQAPIGTQGRSSYAGTITPAPSGFRRASSLYLPNSTPSMDTPTQKAMSPTSNDRNGLITLARRTAHISTTPGYGWRLHLLEKLEIIMGVFLTITEAEDILSIGNGIVEKKAASRANSRKSQIGMPTSAASNSNRSRLPQPSSGQQGGFFGKMKRVLTHNEPPQDKSPTNTKAPPAKVVFGRPLSVVAEYGFVTSMIAGQRHDLPGVCFSAVEEIYRRGQGTKIPGLLQLPGEPSRVAKLVNIFDTAPDYGEHHDLSIESIHNVTALLKKYLRDLPEPVLDQRLWRLYLVACVDSNKPLKVRIACAQIILRLLPAPNFSLMVYLVAFLSQMPLFPENRLTLENVSYIFGPAAMSARTHSSAASKLGKLVSGSMVITGPTENQDFVGVTVKKAQDGLFWLLSHWSAVADGLLETDFDVDTEYVLERSPLPPPVNAFAPLPIAQPSYAEPPYPPQLPAISTHTLEIIPPDYSSYKGSSSFVSSNKIPSGPSSPIKSNFSNIHSQPPPQSGAPPLLDHRSAPRVPSPLPPHTPPKEQVTKSQPPPMPAARPAPASVAESPSVASVAASPSTNFGATPDMPTSESSRSSDSTLESLRSGAQTHAPIFHDLTGGSKQTSTAPSGFARATPEDEFGPLGPAGTSVLDDLLEQDAVDTPASIYNFPTPPASQQSSFNPYVEPVKQVPIPAARIPAAPSNDMLLVRSKDEQLAEAQQLQDSQRREIQKLWKELTDIELARAAERSEVETLRMELAELRGQLATTQQDHSGLREMEARCQEANQAMLKAQEELKMLRDKRDLETKTSRERELEAEAQIAELNTQLNGIRSLLGGGFAKM